MKQLRGDHLRFVLMAGIIAVTLVLFWQLFDVVVLAVSLAVVLYPVHQYCCRSLDRYFSAALVTVLTFLVFTAAVIASAAIITSNSDIIGSNVSAIQDWIQNPETETLIFGIPFDRELAAGWFEKAQILMVSYWNTVISDPALIALKLVVFFCSLYVFLLHGAAIRDRIMAGVPDDLKGYVLTLSAVTVDTLYAIYIVHLGISLLTFVIAIPVLMILGYGSVLLYAFLCGLCEIVPILGASAFFLFLGLYSLSIGDIRGVLIVFFLGYVGVAALPEIYIRPVLMGRRVKIHPLIMLVGFLGGLITMGMAGFILGPVLLVLLFTGYKILIGERKSHREHGAPSSGQSR